MAEQGIVPQPVAAGTLEANGRAERLIHKNRTIFERVWALLHYFNLSASLWKFAIEAVGYT
jgi:hypothetical protein